MPPPVAEHRLTFESDGTWRFDSKVAVAGGDPDAYIAAHGGGEWKLADGILSYTAGDNRGSCKACLDGAVLVLGKDPVLQLNHVADKTSVYERTGA